MRIVVLDGHTLNPGDLSWDALREFGDVTVYDRTPPEKTLERAREADVLLINKTYLDGETIRECPKLRYIGLLSTGTNAADKEAARERDIPVTHVPSYATDSVAQHVFALLLELANRPGHHSETVRNGKWTASEHFCYWDFPLVELTGLTMGIVGYGDIGSAVCVRARAFGMDVLAYDIDSTRIDSNVTSADLDTLFSQSDVVSLNCPLTPQTEDLVDKYRLAQMKNTAFLINTSRGAVVDEDALAQALNTGQIAGAGLDVMATEPPDADNPLFRAENCIITPHLAWATRSARSRLMDTVVANVRAFLDGEPQNVVN